MQFRVLLTEDGFPHFLLVESAILNKSRKRLLRDKEGEELSLL